MTKMYSTSLLLILYRLKFIYLYMRLFVTYLKSLTKINKYFDLNCIISLKMKSALLRKFNICIYKEYSYSNTILIT